MSKPRAIVSVINDLATDQRVNRTCILLYDLGYDVLLVGRVLKKSPPLPERPYKMHRMKLMFERGAKFYAVFNIRLFFFLLFRKCDLFFSNDLDTVLPNYLISKLKRKPVIYDSHEYFTGVPEIADKPFVRKVWKSIEKFIFPRIDNLITVNGSIADLFLNDYGKRPLIIRNMPDRKLLPEKISRTELGLPDDKTIAILQGSGINMDRGGEELVQAMQFTNDELLLLIVGDGDVVPKLKLMAEELKLNGKIKFFPRLPYEKLMQFTLASDFGLSLDKDTNINYRFSLPNKIFDYIQAGKPVFASNLPEVSGIVKGYNVGRIFCSHDPKKLAESLDKMVVELKNGNQWSDNLKSAANELHWGNEQEKLKQLIQAI